MTIVRISALFLAVLSLGADVKREADPDLRAMQGNWEMISWQLGRTEFLKIAKPKAKIKAHVKGNQFCIEFSEGDALKHRIRLDASHSPKWIDFLDDDGKVETKGIYKMEGGVLTICWLDKDTRPTEFLTKDRPGYRLFIFERNKK